MNDFQTFPGITMLSCLASHSVSIMPQRPPLVLLSQAGRGAGGWALGASPGPRVPCPPGRLSPALPEEALPGEHGPPPQRMHCLEPSEASNPVSS